MEESCKVCRKWQSHVYWSHRDPINVKFFVKMEASFRRYLNLPRKFAKNFKGKISEIVKLKDPDGKTWQIEVFKSYNNISLCSGWRDFVTANNIDENDLLVFKYSSSSSFDVVIFDPSGHEKAAALMIKNEESESESESETVKTSSDSDTSIRVFIPPEKISSASVISSPAICAANRERNGDGTSRHASKKAKQALSDKPYHVPINLELSVMQQKIADEMASATQPGSKLFLKILSSSDLQGRLVWSLFTAAPSVLFGSTPALFGLVILGLAHLTSWVVWVIILFQNFEFLLSRLSGCSSVRLYLSI